MQCGLISGIKTCSKAVLEYILEKISSTSEVGPILALIAPSPLSFKDKFTRMSLLFINKDTCTLFFFD
jgi:hypothetical protein